ncbi:MAG: hypothetical protein L3J46_10715 [Kangiellaceae bacterium]|nr:hypothetical protein [Kangiellaceae bacterium]
MKLLKTNILKYALLFIAIFLLSSCGFHLRGQGHNNFIGDFENEKLYLAITSQDKILLRQIKMDLQLARFSLVDDPEKSSNHLIVLSTTFDKRVIGTDQNGRDNEFKISQTVEYIVNHYVDDHSSDKHKKTPQDSSQSDFVNQADFENQQVRSHRSYYFDNNDPIGKKAEEDSLRDSMRAELSRKMINHLLISLSKLQQASAINR